MEFLIMYVQILMIMMGYLRMGPSEALKYYVGGKEGWSLNTSKTFNHWASQNRFQVNDSLIFEYKKDTDSVLQVDQDDYETCNLKNPILNLENSGDHSTFNFNHSGLFFFISGHADNCQKGQKIIILVMAPRNYTYKSPSPAPALSPVTGITPPSLSDSSPVVPPASSALPFGPSTGPVPSPASGDEEKSGGSSVFGGDVVMVVMMFWIVFI